MESLPQSLRYSTDSEPGFSRESFIDKPIYRNESDKVIKCEKTLSRLNQMAIPPAYKNVWICKDPQGHLQATGIDERGRKQYRYHTDWTEFRANKKFDRLVEFAETLPTIRRRVGRHLNSEIVDKNLVCAALVRIVDQTGMRAGSEQYAKTNGSYGATTLRRKHIKLYDQGIKFDYRAKGGKRVRRSLSDKKLLRVLEQIDDLPGRRLFQYVGASGDVHNLDSQDVNAYLGSDFSLKTFRTWKGTLAAFEVAIQSEPLTIKALCEAAADTLKNTPSICRSSYCPSARDRYERYEL